MTITLNGDTGITTPTYGGNVTAEYQVPVTAFKNRIINGAMMIDQRYAGAATANTINNYTLDRWYVAQSTTGKIIVQQNAGAVTPPSGFTTYLGVTSQSAYSVGAGDYYSVLQKIEGYNIADLGWGNVSTGTAAPVTISFWVRSSLTGLFGGSVINGDFTRSYPFSYTISAANTWERKTITVTGCTDGTWNVTNGIGLFLLLGLGYGSTYGSGTAGAWVSANQQSVTGATSVVGTNGATFYITGVQLEKGSTATSFDYRPYGTELALCQRYCHAYSSYSLGRARDGDTVYGGGVTFGVTMRATPTLRSGASFTVSTGSAGTPQISSVSGTASSPDNVYITSTSSSWTTNALIALTGIFEAEL